MQRGDYDALTFASGSAARAFVDVVGSPGELGLSIPDDPNKLVVCIGSKTARAAKGAGFVVSAIAGEPSDAGVIDAIEAPVTYGPDDGSGISPPSRPLPYPLFSHGPFP